MSDVGGFWARRRAAVAAEEVKHEAALEAEVDREVAALQEEKSDAQILEELELPDPDSLKPGDDIAGFMSKAVPERLRRRALRQLWKLNPVLANLDELVDYGEDFTDKAMVVEAMQTTYQVGKGMLAHVQEMARQEEAKEAAERAVAAGEVMPDEDQETEEEELSLELAEEDEPEPAPFPVFEDDTIEGDAAPLRPRRMTFTYAQETA